MQDKFWINESAREGVVSGATYAMSHRRNVRAQWRDTTGISEDHDFLRQLMALDQPGFRQESPSYVVCHYRGGAWDV